jgi:glutathione-regulated potassium-efflux system ancillary protein KefC
MGLFFMTVGMSIDFSQVIKQPMMFAGAVLLVMAIKMAVLVELGRAFKLPRRHVPFFAVVLCQVGEFAFVLLGAAHALEIIDFEVNQALMALVALSMLLTPVLVVLYDKVYVRFFDCVHAPEADVIEPEDNPVIIAGFGRFGQIVGRLLYANRIKAVVMDYEPTQIELVRRFGFKVRYGDATRLDLLEAAGAAQAQILVVAIDDVESSLKLVDIAKENFPHLKIYARARNVAHMYSLMDRNVEAIEREILDSSLRLGSAVLRGLGWPAYQSVVASNIFREHNIQMTKELYSRRDNQDEMIAKSKQARDDLEKMFQKESEYLNQSESWDSERDVLS